MSRPSVQTPCQHNFCTTCLSNYFTHNKVAKIKCPVCLVSIHVNNITASPRLLCVQLDNLDVACITCHNIGKICKFVNHQCTSKIPTKPTVKIFRDKCKLTHKFLKIMMQQMLPRILKALASKHEAGNPIPIEIEQATGPLDVEKTSTRQRAQSFPTHRGTSK